MFARAQHGIATRGKLGRLCTVSDYLGRVAVAEALDSVHYHVVANFLVLLQADSLALGAVTDRWRLLRSH